MEEKVLNIPVEDILPNRFQPRLAFDEKELNELSNSIKRYGIVQPIVLRRIGNKYEIIAGERRYKATVLAGLKTIPAVIKNTDDNTSAEIALLENLQRKNLTVIEEAQSYKKLIDRHFTQEEIANKLGISQSTIANRMRLLNLPKKVQDALLYNKISERHARSLLSLNDEEKQLELLDKIINNRLTVRQTEEEISRILNKVAISDNNIPDQILQIMKDKEIINFDENNKPEVVNIEDKEESEKINPFQSQFEQNVRKIEENIDNHADSFYDRIISEDLKNNNFDYPDVKEEHEEKVVETEVKEEPKVEDVEPLIEDVEPLIDDVEPLIDKPNNLPKTISKVRSFINGLNDNSIEISEMDLEDKYQIIISIKKDD